MTDHKDYVVGFLFIRSGDVDHGVVLIQKNRPPWQAGKLNGVGGHREPGETPHEAMVREFEEEAGRHVPVWFPVLTMEGPGYTLDVFRAYADDAAGIETKTDESIFVIPVNAVGSYDLVPNLRWIIPLVQHFDEGGYHPFTVWTES